MFGFLIGTACLIGLISVLRRGRHGGGCGGGWHWHGHHGHRGYGDQHEGRRSRRRGFSFGMLNVLFERLDTTPGQEKAIRAAVEEFVDAGRKARSEARRSREDLARAVSNAQVDEVVLGEMFARHDEELLELRKALVGSLAKIVDVLDERQRRSLADAIESGPSFFRGGPYRSSWA